MSFYGVTKKAVGKFDYFRILPECCSPSVDDSNDGAIGGDSGAGSDGEPDTGKSGGAGYGYDDVASAIGGSNSGVADSEDGSVGSYDAASSDEVSEVAIAYADGTDVNAY